MRPENRFPSFDLGVLPRAIKENSFLKRIFPKHANPDGAKERQVEVETSAGPSLIHAEGARRSARANLERAVEQGRASSDPMSPEIQRPGGAGEPTEHTVLRQPHLAARIARFLSPNEQRMLLHQITSGSFRQSLGPSPRFDVMRELSTQQKQSLLASPVMAKTVLDEALSDPSDARGALRSSSLLPYLPSQALRGAALTHVWSRLNYSLRHERPLHPDFGQIVLNVSKLFGEARLDRATSSVMLSLVEQNLGYLERDELGDGLRYLLGGMRRVDRAMKQKATLLVEKHIGRLPSNCLVPVLNGVALSLDSREVMRPGSEDDARHQQRLLRLLQAHLPRLPDMEQQVQPIIRFAQAAHLFHEAETVLLEMLSNILTHCSHHDSGEIMVGLAGGFEHRYRTSIATQNKVIGLIEQHVPRASLEHTGRVLEQLPKAFLRGMPHPIEPDVTARVFNLIQRYFNRAPVASQMQTLLNAANLLKSREINPQWINPILQFVAAKLPHDLASLGPNREKGEKVISSIAKGIGVLDNGAQAHAFAFIEQRLASMTLAGRVRTLNALMASGLERESTRQGSLDILHAHLPDLLSTADATSLSMHILRRNHLHHFSPVLVNQAAALLVEHAGTIPVQTRANALRSLVLVLSDRIDVELQERALVLINTHLPDEPLRSKGRLLEYLTEQLTSTEPAMAERLAGIICTNLPALRNDTHVYLANSLSNMTAALSSPVLSLGSKRQLMRAIASNIAFLPWAARENYQQRIAENMMRFLRSEHFNDRLARPALDLANVVIADCVTQQDTRNALEQAVRSLRKNNQYRQVVNQILAGYRSWG